MGTEVAQVDMLGVEAPRCFRFAFDLIAEVASSDMDRVETQVDIRFRFEGILTGKSVQNELQVERTLGRFPAKVEREPKEASGGKDQLLFQ